jgi:hypothetical protein
VKEEAFNKINIKIVEPSSFGYYFANVFPYLLPILFIGLIF